MHLLDGVGKGVRKLFVYEVFFNKVIKKKKIVSICLLRKSEDNFFSYVWISHHA